MKRFFTRALFMLMFVMLLPLTAKADAVEIDGIWYNLISKAKTAEVTRNPSIALYDGCYSGIVTIPSKVTYGDIEYNVNVIGESAFANSTDLTSVQLPSNIITIGNSAFNTCRNLINIQLPNNIETIGEWAFASCEHLPEISIPNSVTSIGNYAFCYCYQLTSFTFPQGISRTGHSVLSDCTNLEQVIMNNNITEIGNYAFSDCSNLLSIEIPNSVTIIGTGAFDDCTSLTSITIPNSVTNIKEHAFRGCSSLSVVTIGRGVLNIRTNSFANCSELTDVYCFAENVPTTSGSTFENSYVNYATLHVPASSISSYSTTAPWSDFGTITAITSEDITIGDLGIGTFCGSNPIDFTGIEDIKAYVVSSYEKATGQVTLTRTYYIPPFTGVVVKGNKGVYTIPAGVGQPVYPNMMKGVTANTALNKVSGDYTNYVLANKGGNLGFYAITNGTTLAAGKAYLPLPTDDLPTAARGLTLSFDDGETTEIMKVASQEETPRGCFDLQGRRVANPTSGLYIMNGKKVIIK